MCLAVPVQVKEVIDENIAKVEIDGVGLSVSRVLVENLEIDDYVLIHAGFIIEKLLPEDAQDKLSLYAEYQRKTGQI